MALSGNGSVITRSGLTSGVTQMEYRETCAETDVTSLTDTMKVYEPGLPERSITATLLGPGTDIVVGAAATTTCTFGAGGTPTTSYKFVCTKNDQENGIDGAISSSVAFVQTTA